MSFFSPVGQGAIIFPRMTPRFIRCLFALLLAAQISGCAMFRPRPKKATLATHAKPLLVGTIKLVNDDGHFALIDSGTSPGPLPGTVLTCRAASGETGELKAGEVRRRPFAIADVVKGTPQVGDQVFQQPP